MVNDNFQIPGFEELFFSLPFKYRTNKVREELRDAYKRELQVIGRAVARLKKEKKPYLAKMFLFGHLQGSQIIADFWVKDLSTEEKREYNWHLQNVSQWKYAGCILFSVTRFKDGADYIISTHH